ncbi:hypothetical protein R3P38DRAFT_1747375 [Favolaschia claudopus]|uniref:Uncharacterized protein n=1 Tax=Favolaschia claudopus TaxID=2862362 RepID=A0AAW0DGA3_9AGAR
MNAGPLKNMLFLPSILVSTYIQKSTLRTPPSSRRSTHLPFHRAHAHRPRSAAMSRWRNALVWVRRCALRTRAGGIPRERCNSDIGRRYWVPCMPLSAWPSSIGDFIPQFVITRHSFFTFSFPSISSHYMLPLVTYPASTPSLLFYPPTLAFASFPLSLASFLYPLLPLLSPSTHLFDNVVYIFSTRFFHVCTDIPYLQPTDFFCFMSRRR